MLNDTRVAFATPGEVLAAAIVLPIVGIIAVGTRFWVRIALKQGLKVDDWTIAGALAMVIGMGISLIWGVVTRKSIGYPSTPYPVPMATIAEEELVETTPQQSVVFVVYWVVWLLMIPANGLIKISAVYLYRRIFLAACHEIFNIVTWSMLVICVVWTVGFGLAQIFGCRNDFYKPFGTLGDVASCHTNTRLNALMITDLTTDVLVWTLPIPVIWQLKMSFTQKMSANAILSLAAMSLVAAVVRLIIEVDIANGGYDSAIDTDLVLTNNLYWTMLESGLALIAACLPVTCVPTVRLIVQKFIKKKVDHVRSRFTGDASESDTCFDGEQSETYSNETIACKEDAQAAKKAESVTSQRGYAVDIEHLAAS